VHDHDALAVALRQPSHDGYGEVETDPVSVASHQDAHVQILDRISSGCKNPGIGLGRRKNSTLGLN
jgi:hypothetical protein